MMLRRCTVCLESKADAEYSFRNGKPGNRRIAQTWIESL